MKKALLIFWILTCFVQIGRSQTRVLSQENISFGSEKERAIWASNTEDPLQLFQAVQADRITSESPWSRLVAELDSKSGKGSPDFRFLRRIFQTSHQQLFKKYEQHSNFNLMLSEGQFDCVSGSAALGILLTRYGYEFDIIETDYHVFIVVDLEGKKAVLESTLRIGGMITSPTEIAKYLEVYRPKLSPMQNASRPRLSDAEIDYGDDAIFRKVSLTQLAGLQYYNDAIAHFNTQAFRLAVEQLSKAYLLYPSDRILDLRELSIDLAYRSYGYDPKK